MSENTGQITVRELIRKAAESTDMDAVVCFSINNSDPIEVDSIRETEDGKLMLESTAD